MKKKSEHVELNGEVLDKDKRNVVRIGSSNHISLPAKWKKFLTSPILELRLVKDEDGELCLIITKPSKEELV